MKKLQLLIISGSFQILSSQTGNIGINTPTPLKALHVNGGLQLTNELNVGGTASADGNSGDLGQALISQGSGLPPIWKTLNIPTDDDDNSYQLKGVYRGILTNAAISQIQTSKPIGTVNNIKVSSADNFIFVISQNSISTNRNSGSTNSSSSSFRYRFNGNLYTSPVEMLKREDLPYASKGITYSFCIPNVPVGTYSLETSAYRESYSGGGENVFFNMEPYGPMIPGSIVIFVYEK